MPGMVAFIVGTGDSVNDIKLHKSIAEYTGTKSVDAQPVITGQLYIVQVNEKQSIGIFYSGSYALPGDTVYFK